MSQSKRPKIYELGIHYPKITLAVVLVLSLFSIFVSRILEIETDPITLLPKKTPSVVALNEFKKYFGSNNFLMISLESDNPENSLHFADLFIEKIKDDPHVIFIDFRRPVDFLLDRQWLYVSEDDLKAMETRVDSTLELEKHGVSLVFKDFIDLTDPEDRPDLSFEDILEKYKKKPWIPQKVGISDNQGRFQVIRIKVSNEISDEEEARKFISHLQDIEKNIKKTFSPSVKVGFSGSLANRIEQNDYIKEQIFFVSILVALALTLIIYAYFRNFESLYLIGLPILSGIIMTGGVLALTLGHLNIITSFAMGIIAGLGSDYGIYLLNRFYQERGAGHSFEEACRLAFANTGIATYGSMISTVGCFVALLFSKFGFFFEFGIAGAVGILLNYTLMMLMIPSFLKLIYFKKWGDLQEKPFRSTFDPNNKKVRGMIHALFVSKPGVLPALFMIACLASALAIRGGYAVNYASDLTENKNLPSQILLERVGHAVKTSLNPTILMAPSQEEEEKVLQKLNEILEKSHPDDLVYNNVVGLSTFIYKESAKKKEVLRRIAEKIKRVRWLPANNKKQYLESLYKSININDVTRENMPQAIKQFFESPVDPHVLAIYFYPSFGRNSNFLLARYHNGVSKLIKENNLNVIPVDTNFAADDIITLIDHEAPRGLIVIFIFLAFIYYFINRSIRRTFVVVSTLIGCILLLLGVLKLVGIELNIMNILAIPIILGTGIDSFIHFAQHYDEQKDMILALREKIPAILVSNITSMVGFAGLLITQLPGLISLGWTSLLGLSIITLSCVFIFPRCLTLERQASPR